jgi:hypothetical protein
VLYLIWRQQIGWYNAWLPSPLESKTLDCRQLPEPLRLRLSTHPLMTAAVGRAGVPDVGKANGAKADHQACRATAKSHIAGP